MATQNGWIQTNWNISNSRNITYSLKKAIFLIRVYTIFDVMIDGCHKSCVVADGHLTATPSESVYSGVVPLRCLRTCVFIGEFDGRVPWATDIGNAYLEAVTSEKVYIRAGSEFGEPRGHLLIIYKTLYGLRLSGNLFKPGQIAMGQK